MSEKNDTSTNERDIDALLSILWQDGRDKHHSALTALVAERNELKRQRDEARLLTRALLEGTGDSRSNAIAAERDWEAEVASERQ